MPRNRMIKPEFWDDEKLGSVSRDARLTFIGMWNNSDDYGVVRGNSAWLKSRLYAYDDIKTQTFEKWLQELESIKVIISFTAGNDEKFYYIRKFLDHQTIKKPSQTRNPQPPENILGKSDNNSKIQEKTESTPLVPHQCPTSTPPVGNEIEIEGEVEIEGKINPFAHECAGKGSTVHVISDFDKFWAAYPRKKSKGQAQKAWNRLRKNNQLPSVNVLLNAIAAQKAGHDWRKDGGQYIPYPATWLNALGWQDEQGVFMFTLPKNQTSKNAGLHEQIRKVGEDWLQETRKGVS